MRVSEYQSKQFFKQYSIPVLDSKPATSSEEAYKAAQELGGNVFVVKAQILAGGRGKAGGIKLVQSAEEARVASKDLLGKSLVTPQTGKAGEKVEQVLIEKACNIKKEYYLSLLVSTSSSQILAMASREGGMDIEEVAESSPEKIFKSSLTIKEGWKEGEIKKIFQNLQITESCFSEFSSLLKNLHRLFCEKDVNLLEINPLIESKEGKLIALDGKMIFDENALYRHKDLLELSRLEKKTASEELAQKHQLSFIQLDGNIACMVNGAGLAMATMDIIKFYGGSPANFLDVGGGATEEKITQAFKIIFQSSGVKACLVNIFGGIMRCDILAAGLIKALKLIKTDIPIIVRLEGTRAKEGRKLLAESGLKLTTATNLDEAAQKAVEVAGK